MITQSCSSKAHSARRLPPAAFDEDVSIVPALPPGGHPHGMFTGRNVPSSRLPDICSTVPAVIPGDPDVPPARSVRAVLVNADRRAQLYHYLRSLGRSYPQGNPNERVHKKFPHRRILLKGYGEHAHGRSGCEARQHSRRRADGRSRPAVAWPPPTAQRVGGRAEAVRLARPGGRQLGAGQRIGEAGAAARMAALGPRSHGRRPPRNGLEAGWRGKTGSAGRPAAAPGSDRRSRRRRMRPEEKVPVTLRISRPRTRPAVSRGAVDCWAGSRAREMAIVGRAKKRARCIGSVREYIAGWRGVRVSWD